MSNIEVEIREFRTGRSIQDTRALLIKAEEEVIGYLRDAGYVETREVKGAPPDFVMVLWRVTGGFGPTQPHEEIGRYCNPGASLERIRQDLHLLRPQGTKGR